jgi:hypothetical protein
MFAETPRTVAVNATKSSRNAASLAVLFVPQRPTGHQQTLIHGDRCGGGQTFFYGLLALQANSDFEDSMSLVVTIKIGAAGREAIQAQPSFKFPTMMPASKVVHHRKYHNLL